MKFGYYLGDIQGFDDLIDWLEDHITGTRKDINVDKTPKYLPEVLKNLILENLSDEIDRYGWTGDEEFKAVEAVNMFHKIFSSYNRNLYFHWLSKNYKQIELNSPFDSVDMKDALNKLENTYAEDGVTLTDEAMIHELKRGMHKRAFSMVDELRKSIVNYGNIQSISSEGKLNAMEVKEKLLKEMEELYHLEKKVDEFIERIENLSIKTFNDQF
jgi:hypothetical protein